MDQIDVIFLVACIVLVVIAGLEIFPRLIALINKAD
jgi:hypothetical protein